MRIVIVEDIALAAAYMKKTILSLRPDWEVVGEADSVDGAAICILQVRPDLVFLDVRLSDGDAFEIFEKIDSDAAVIFTTAYDAYALKAFEVNSIDYLLKPIGRDALERALTKFERLHHQHAHAMPTLEDLTRIFRTEKQPYKQRFITTSGTHIHSVSTENVAFLRADDNVVFLVTFDKKEHIVSETLTKLATQLNPETFFRVNRKFVINYNAIDRMSNHTKGRTILTLMPSANEDVIVSAGHSGAFRRWLDR